MPTTEQTSHSSAIWPRVLPFAAYMSFIGVSSFLPEGNSHLWLYPLKTLIVGGLLVYFWSQLSELHTPLIADWREGLWAGGVGLLVFTLWIQMDWDWATQSAHTGYNPFAGDPVTGMVLAGFRLFGAVIVVPIMEEVFWRSFLIRYIIDSRFETVRLGTFTLGSFLGTVILFGLEHNLWLAGMMAGVAYNLLLYKTGRLWPCILAHGLTNAALGVYVLLTSEWQWW